MLVSFTGTREVVGYGSTGARKEDQRGHRIPCLARCTKAVVTHRGWGEEIDTRCQCRASPWVGSITMCSTTEACIIYMIRSKVRSILNLIFTFSGCLYHIPWLQVGPIPFASFVSWFLFVSEKLVPRRARYHMQSVLCEIVSANVLKSDRFNNKQVTNASCNA